MLKRKWRTIALFCIYVAALMLIGHFIYVIYQKPGAGMPQPQLILSLNDYGDAEVGNIVKVLHHRIQMQPFNLVSLAIFACAIVHTFFAHYFLVLSKKLREHNIKHHKSPVDSFAVEILRFMGEVEVIFGLWVIPLLLALAYSFNWNVAIDYMNDIDYLEPLFVVVIMAMASTRPIIKLAEECLKFIAKIGGESVRAWWWVILTLGPVSGSLITEPGAMTISALLLSKQFYAHRPRPAFAYATLGLLFTNISVGGVLTNFAAPPVLIVSKNWQWDASYMLSHFGWKAVVGILIANMTYYLLFRKDFRALEKKKKERVETKKEAYLPFWISAVHLLFLAWVVAHNHYPVIFIGAFLLFLGFHQATLPYQKPMELKPAILVGFFLAGLVIHGGLQAWWIEPLLKNATQEALLVMSGVLTSFNDNAEITFLASLIPSFEESMKYAVVAGAISGGGLTVIANAPNPTGQAILRKYFSQGVSAVSLLLSALLPAITMGLCFYILKGL